MWFVVYVQSPLQQHWSQLGDVALELSDYASRPLASWGVQQLHPATADAAGGDRHGGDGVSHARTAKQRCQW